MRLEDGPLLRGEARYVADLAGPDAVHVAFVRSPHAHARIVGIESGEGVFTAADLDLGPIAAPAALSLHFARAPLAVDTVRFVGEPVAVVVAESRAAAADAIEQVVVEWDPLPAVVDPEQGELAIENVLGAEDDVLAGCEIVVRARLVNQRVAPAPMEADGAYAEPAPNGEGVVLWASTQRVHTVRDAVAGSLRLDPSRVRVIAPQVGGGFGGKFEPAPEAVVVAALAHRLQRPVSWVQSRTENLQSMPHGRGQVQHGALGLRGDGTFVGIWCDTVGDAGAYPMVGALIPFATVLMAPGTYRFERAGGRHRAKVTNTTPVGAFRGAGRPEAAAFVERLVDLAATELGVDPVELRRRNLVPAGAFPHRSATGMTYDSGDYPACLEGAVAAIGYDDVRREQTERRQSGSPLALGVGVAMWVDCTPMNPPREWASVEVVSGGRVVVADGSGDQGQAHHSTWALLVADRLGLPVEAVDLLPADTATAPTGFGTGSARSLMLAGGAIDQAAARVADEARQRAAELLEAAPGDIVLADGRLSVAGSPAVAVSWDDLLATGPLGSDGEYEQSGSTFPAGCHAAVVEVDTETGHVRLLRFAAVDDCGRVVNPQVVAGQQHGGVVQGIAQALYEQAEYDADANPLTSTFADYGIPSAAEVPALDVATIDVVSPVNTLGAKGIGQAGAIGSTPAVQNAVVDALAHLGVRHVDLPLTPERVWREISAAGT